MYVYCVESFAHIEYYSDCSPRGAIWLNPFATVLFSVCSDVTVVLCFVPVFHECVWYACCYVKKKALLQCLCNYREEGYRPVCGALVCVIVGFWDRDCVSQLPCLRYYGVVKNSLSIFVRNASPRGPMYFRCLIFCLSGPCELLFLLCFIASWT